MLELARGMTRQPAEGDRMEKEIFYTTSGEVITPELVARRKQRVAAWFQRFRMKLARIEERLAEAEKSSHPGGQQKKTN
jgi:hypothetical protein